MIPLVLASMRRRWLEYALASAAIGVIGAMLLVQRSLTSSAEKAVHELAHQLGSNMLVVPADTDLGAYWSNRYGSEMLPDDAATRLRASPLAPHLRQIESRLQGTVPLKDVEVVLVGTDADAFGSTGGDVVPAITTRALVKALGLGPGHIVQVGGHAVAITRVLDGVSGHPGDALYVPLAGAQRILKRAGAINALQVGGCWCSVDVATLGKEVERTLPGSRAFTVAGMLSAQKGTVAVTQQYATLLRIGGALAVALLVATVAASQTRRRNREVALFAAVGANPSTVAALFIAEAAIAGATGGLVAVLLAQITGDWLGTRLVGGPLQVGWDMLVPAVALSASIAAIAAAVPSLRAAKTDVATILREA